MPPTISAARAVVAESSARVNALMFMEAAQFFHRSVLEFHGIDFPREVHAFHRLDLDAGSFTFGRKTPLLVTIRIKSATAASVDKELSSCQFAAGDGDLVVWRVLSGAGLHQDDRRHGRLPWRSRQIFSSAPACRQLQAQHHPERWSKKTDQAAKHNPLLPSQSQFHLCPGPFLRTPPAQ